MATPITFVVPGQPSQRERGATRAGGPEERPGRLPGGLVGGTLKHSVRLRATRSDGSQVRVEADPDNDVVVIQIANGPDLVLNPETARDLLLAQGGAPPARRDGDVGDTGDIPVAAQVQWRGLVNASVTRGERGIGGALVSAFHVVSGVLQDKPADLTAEQIAKRFDGQVDDAVYSLESEVLPKLKEKGKRVADNSIDGSALVLVHGTFSSTQGTFQKLWTHHPDLVDRLFRKYKGQVYALDHATLGRSPIENALVLAKSLRKGASLDLVTHSRGGLVAEVLAKVCADRKLAPTELGDFKKPDYKEQLDLLNKLADVIRERDIKVNRVVRVACPVRGTLLASKRLDAYVSVFKWSLELAQVPVAPALVEFLGAVAQRRTDPGLMPGLAAQIPGSPLVQWLHAGSTPIEGDLRVIAGDLAGDSVGSWIKTLLSNAFYWTDNDLVVQTRGMYGGPRRKSTATFLLDQGGQVSHFNYFTNDRSAEAVVNAVTESAPQGFQTIGRESWAGTSSTGVRAGPNADTGAAAPADRPAVILVPDVLASHLAIDGERVWLGEGTASQFKRLAFDGPDTLRVKPDGLVESSYRDLSNHLARSHDVIPFAYDWRRPIEDGAKLLAELVDETFATRAKTKQSGQPVRIIAHGMGGLLVRAMELAHPASWQRVVAHDDARILLLGVPNGGSWTPMQVLSGDETFGGLLEGLAAPMRDQDTRKIIAGFPGFVQLQAAVDSKEAPLASAATWDKLATDDLAQLRAGTPWHWLDEQIEIYDWGRPSQAVLRLAVDFWTKLRKQADLGFGKYLGKVATVVGTAQCTPDGYDDKGAFTYLDVVAAGDGYVTTKNASLPGVHTWTVTSDHGGLTTNRQVFDAYVQLLEKGTTRDLAPLGATRSGAAETHERRRPSREPSTLPSARTRRLLSTDARDASLGNGSTGPALRVTVSNGNLKFIHQPLMVGHYRSLKLTGTEWVMDDLIGGTMSQLVSLRQYPDAPTSHKIFLNRRQANPWQMPRPKAVIVVGLGEEGKLKTTDLIATVSQGVIAWSQRLAEESANPGAQFELAATLLGSGGAGVSAGQAALAIAQGVREANLRLIDAGFPSVGHLVLIELYLDRATEAWRALQVQMAASSGQYVVGDAVKQGTGALRRPLTLSYRAVEYDFVSAMTQRGAQGEEGIAFRVDTRRARTELHAHGLQLPLLRELVMSASNSENADKQIGRTLFQLLVPPEVESFMGGTTAIVLELDSGSAGIPWELLDCGDGTRNGADKRPWAIRSKLLRKLRTDEYRPQVIDADAEAHILVIGEPKCPDNYRRLPAAREEALAVVDAFTRRSPLRADMTRVLPVSRVRSLIADEELGGDDAQTIMNAVLERPWRIVHIAGHGAPPEKIGSPPKGPNDPPQKIDPRGVVLSNGTFLGPREIGTMRVVPELVFVNCCHLAARDIRQLGAADAPPYDRAKFAAGVAEALIEIGVRCVIAAGWAVGDDEAKVFAQTFYDHLLRGDRFIDAVAAAREECHALGGNTWAAYQCYGDPDWEFRWETGDAQALPVTSSPDVGTADSDAGSDSDDDDTPKPNYAAEFPAVASPPALILALETLATSSQFDDKRNDRELRAKIRYLDGRFGKRWGAIGRVAEAFAHAWQAAGGRVEAIGWYEKAIAASDGTASMRATEQLGNQVAREAGAQVKKALKRVQSLEDRAAATDDGKLADAREQLRDAIDSRRKEVQYALGMLEDLAKFRPTLERWSLCGSAWKQKAIIEEIAGGAAAKAEAITQMRDCYGKAETLANERRPGSELYYPALNRMAAELIVDAKNGTWRGFDPPALKRINASLDAKIRRDADFWSVIGKTELKLYEALGRRDLARDNLTKIIADYDNHRKRVSDASQWDTVLTQLEFVLLDYMTHASDAERQAASDLLDHVRRIVRRTPRTSTG